MKENNKIREATAEEQLATLKEKYGEPTKEGEDTPVRGYSSLEWTYHRIATDAEKLALKAARVIDWCDHIGKRKAAHASPSVFLRHHIEDLMLTANGAIARWNASFMEDVDESPRYEMLFAQEGGNINGVLACLLKNGCPRALGLILRKDLQGEEETFERLIGDMAKYVGKLAGLTCENRRDPLGFAYPVEPFPCLHVRGILDNAAARVRDLRATDSTPDRKEAK